MAVGSLAAPCLRDGSLHLLIFYGCAELRRLLAALLLALFLLLLLLLVCAAALVLWSFGGGHYRNLTQTFKTRVDMASHYASRINDVINACSLALSEDCQAELKHDYNIHTKIELLGSDFRDLLYYIFTSLAFGGLGNKSLTAAR